MDIFSLRARSVYLNGGDLSADSISTPSLKKIGASLIIGNEGVGGLFLSNSNSHLLAPELVDISQGEGYFRTAGTADWITNHSALSLNSPYGILELPADTYSLVSFRANANGSYTLEGETTVLGSIDVEAPIQVADKTLNVGQFAIYPIEGAGIFLTTGKLTSAFWGHGSSKFDAGQGTVELYGTEDAYLRETTTFYNLKVDTSSEEAGKKVHFLNNQNFTVNGTLTLKGAPGKILTLQSDTSEPFYITVPGDIVVDDYLNVSNSHVIGGTITTGSNSVDGGGNSGWIFGYPTPTPTATPDITPLPDTSGPNGGVKINKDKRITTSRFVILTLSATDPSLPLTMRLSNNGKKWTSWKPYKRLRSWDLTNKESGGNRRKGYKWVYVQYRDNLKNRSKTYIDRIKYIKKK